ncbi:MAG TPA: 5-formyltetrahydrofolate cyclo-ligase [Rhizomicrobium sp.]|jgi:5-formyltetrahydrofolate cyclo-ligase|nr:5-formyltetrahydrofolate cyclo-ligase [Rhizomicrobium sp.]
MPDKAQLRVKARQRRASLRGADFARRLAAYAALLAVAPGTMVGGYHAHESEADPALLLKALAESGAHIAFPRITAKDAALDFHLVPDGEILSPGRHGIHEPLAHWPKVTPALLLVPLLAYDDQGYRLGYGGGYYDRTLAALNGARAIGLAYGGQRMESLPHDPHDYPLDAVLTEYGLKEFAR